MATKAKGKAKAVSSQPAAVSQAGAPSVPLVDAVELRDVLERRVGRFFGDTTGVDKLQQRVESLRRELAQAEAELEVWLRPLRSLERAMQVEAPSAMDVALAKAVAHVHLVSQRWNQRDKPSGAKPWAEMIARGASDAEIRKNLENVDDHNQQGACYAMRSWRGGNGGKDRYEVEFRQGGRGEHKVLLKGERMVAEVRRVLGIPLPAGKAAAAAKAPRASGPVESAGPARGKKKAAKKKAVSSQRLAVSRKGSGKRAAGKRKAPAAKSKPAGTAGPVVPAGPADRPGPARGKKKYLSGAEKRKRKAEREAAAAAKAVGSQPLAATGPGEGPARASKGAASGAAKFGAHQGLKSAGPAAAAVRELEQIVQKAGEGSLSKLLNCAKPGAPMSAPWAAALSLPEGHPLRAKRVATGGDVGKACEQCGCTYRDECEGGCYWVDLDDPDRWLCNRCAADVPARRKETGPVDPTGPADRPGPARKGAVNSDEVPPAIAKRAARYKGPASKLVGELANGKH